MLFELCCVCLCQIAASQASAAEEDVASVSSGSMSLPKDSASQSPSQPSPNSYRSTQESQLDTAGPIFPDLVDCDKDINLILPQLTSSLWSVRAVSCWCSENWSGGGGGGTVYFVCVVMVLVKV